MSRIFSPGKICVSLKDKISVWKRTWHASKEIKYSAVFLTDQYFCMSTLNLVLKGNLLLNGHILLMHTYLS